MAPYVWLVLINNFYSFCVVIYVFCITLYVFNGYEQIDILKSH